MGNSEATYNQPQDLTTFKVVGKMQISDLYDCLHSDYVGRVTALTLWDATEADLSAITAAEVEKLANYGMNLVEARRGGKTAIVFGTPHDFGLGRMLESHLEIAGLPLEIHVCQSLDEAKEWLGIDEHMVPASTIYNIGGCIQKKETGELDCRRSLKLIHELIAAFKCHKSKNILLDLRDADVQSDMLELMSYAAECAHYGSDFDKKIAIIIPGTPARIETAKLFKSCMDLHGFRIRHFFDYEQTIEWLSE